MQIYCFEGFDFRILSKNMRILLTLVMLDSCMERPAVAANGEAEDVAIIGRVSNEEGTVQLVLQNDARFFP